MTFRLGGQGQLIAFAGCRCRRLTVDGHETVFADREMEQIAWGPVSEARRVSGGAVFQAMAHGRGVVRIPAAGLPADLSLFLEGETPGSRGEPLASRREKGALVFTITEKESGRWIYGVA
jgi:hypothetical protein